MKVLQLGKFYPPVVGGIETVVRDMCRGLVKKHCKVTCVVSSTSSNSSVEVVDGVKVIRLGKLPLRHPVNLALPAYLKRNKFDIVHLHMPNPCAEVSCLLAKPKRLIVSYHADIVGKFGSGLYLPLQRKVLKMADKILVSSEDYANNSDILKPFLHKCVVVPYGIDVKKFAGRKVLLAVPGPVFLFVGRFVKYKGLEYLVRAMKNVEGSLILAGNGPLLSKLRGLAGNSRRVYFLTSVSDGELPALYNACDVFVLPSISRAEAFGIVQLEAMACGKPVISTVSTVNQHMKTGIIVSPRDVVALAGAMKKLSNDKLRLKFGKFAKQRVKREFTMEKMANQILQVYRSSLSST